MNNYLKGLKISLADILTVLGTGVFCFYCFLSFNFLSLGDSNKSLIWAILISLILGGLAFIIKLIKMTNGNFKKYLIWEWILLVLFLVTAYIAIFPFSHYFAVTKEKENIQKNIISNISQGEKMFSFYETYSNERIKVYHRKLKSIVDARKIDPTTYKKYGFSGENDSLGIENKMFRLNAKLLPSNFKEMKKLDSIWLEDSRRLVNTWSPTGVVKVMISVKSEITSWKDELVKYSTFRAPGEITKDFPYHLNFYEETSKITKLGKPTAFSIFLGLFLCAVMLTPYFIATRSTRNLYSLFFFLKKRKIEKDNGIDINLKR